MNFYNLTTNLHAIGPWIILILFVAAVIGLGLLLGTEPEGVIICPKCDNLMTELPQSETARAICPTCGFRERRQPGAGAGHRRQSDKEKS